MRVRLVVNPVASSMTARRLAAIDGALRRAHTVETVTTTGRGDARRLARAAADDGVDVVVVAAGDGTLNEAAGGLVGTASALAPLPGGSTNVFCRAIGYGNRIERAVERLVRGLDHAAIRRVGLGAANGRHFLFHLGCGFDAAVVARMEANPANARIKRFAAHPAFALATVRTLVGGYDRRHPPMRVEVPGHAPHPSFFTVVSNLTPYSYVGPRRMVLTSEAGFGRSLAVTSMTRFRLGDVAAAFGSAVGNAGHLEHADHVAQLHDAEEVRLVAARPDAGFPWQVDGDFLGITTELHVRYEPDALALVLPVR